MNVQNASLTTRPLNQQSLNAASSTPSKKLDNDGDSDNGTGRDDVAKAKNLQTAAQPYLGNNINIRA